MSRRSPPGSRRPTHPTRAGAPRSRVSGRAGHVRDERDEPGWSSRAARPYHLRRHDEIHISAGSAAALVRRRRLPDPGVPAVRVPVLRGARRRSDRLVGRALHQRGDGRDRRSPPLPPGLLAVYALPLRASGRVAGGRGPRGRDAGRLDRAYADELGVPDRALSGSASRGATATCAYGSPRSSSTMSGATPS